MILQSTVFDSWWGDNNCCRARWSALLKSNVLGELDIHLPIRENRAPYYSYYLSENVNWAGFKREFARF